MAKSHSRLRFLLSILTAAAIVVMLHSSAEAATITYDAGSGAPLSYTEAGFTWTSIYTGSGDHLHLGDNDGDSSPDLSNHTGCCSAPYRLTFSGGAFTLNSTTVVGFGGFTTSGTWTGSNGNIFVDPGGVPDYNLSFGALFTNVTYVDWFGNAVIDNTIANAAVPEPTSLLLMGTGLALAARRRRIRRA